MPRACWLIHSCSACHFRSSPEPRDTVFVLDPLLLKQILWILEWRHRKLLIKSVDATEPGGDDKWIRWEKSILKALSGLWWCNATYKAKNIMGQVSFPQEALLCQHRVSELCLESSLSELQPLPRDPYCALALIGEKQFRVALIGVECVRTKKVKVSNSRLS